MRSSLDSEIHMTQIPASFPPQVGIGTLPAWDEIAHRLARLPWLFLGVVVMPATLCAIYYLLIAAPLYVSEAEFVVHTRNQSQSMGVGSMLQSVGVSLGSEQETDAYEVQNYMNSRDAVEDLVKNHRLRDILDRPEGDFLFRFPRFFESSSFESLFRSYRRFVDVNLDTQTGISTLKVRGFRPEDAQMIATALMASGEGLINRLNSRAMDDAVAQSQRQVDDAETRVLEVQTALTKFRNTERLINPTQSSTAGVDLLYKLEEQLDELRAERESLAASARDNPQLPAIDGRITAYNAQIEAERSRLAGQSSSMAPEVSEYERLTLERDMSAKALESAFGGLETARLDARRQQLFLEPVVNPNLPDRALEPNGLLIVTIVLVSGLVIYAIISLLIAGLREHRQL
jgi:capsular polysaccharide transport system permease protein